MQKRKCFFVRQLSVLHFQSSATQTRKKPRIDMRDVLIAFSLSNININSVQSCVTSDWQ